MLAWSMSSPPKFLYRVPGGALTTLLVEYLSDERQNCQVQTTAVTNPLTRVKITLTTSLGVIECLQRLKMTLL